MTLSIMTSSSSPLSSLLRRHHPSPLSCRAAFLPRAAYPFCSRRQRRVARRDNGGDDGNGDDDHHDDARFSNLGVTGGPLPFSFFIHATHTRIQAHRLAARHDGDDDDNGEDEEADDDTRTHATYTRAGLLYRRGKESARARTLTHLVSRIKRGAAHFPRPLSAGWPPLRATPLLPPRNAAPFTRATANPRRLPRVKRPSSCDLTNKDYSPLCRESQIKILLLPILVSSIRSCGSISERAYTVLSPRRKINPRIVSCTTVARTLFDDQRKQARTSTSTRAAPSRALASHRAPALNP